MYCKQCGKQIYDNAVVCTGCGVATGVPVPQQAQELPVASSKTRMAFVLFGLFLGGFGIHNFYAGYTGRGIAQLLITIFGFVLIVPLLIVGLWVLIEVCTVTQDADGLMFT